MVKGDPGTIRCKNTRKIRWEALKEKRRNRAIIKERFMFSWQVLSGCSDFWDGKGNITPLSEEDRKALHELCAKWTAEDLDVVRVGVRALSLRTTDFGFSFFSLSCRFTRTLSLLFRSLSRSRRCLSRRRRPCAPCPTLTSTSFRPLNRPWWRNLL